MVEQFAQLLQIGLAGSVIDRRRTFRQHRRHDDIRRTGDGRLIQKHIRAFEMRSAKTVRQQFLVVLESSAEIDHSLEMGIKTTTADLISAGFGISDFSQTRQERADEHDRTT